MGPNGAEWGRTVLNGAEWGRGVPQGSAPFEAAMARCHERGAERLLRGALRNGGLYVKLGQGLCAMGHLLPPQYPRVLRALEDSPQPKEDASSFPSVFSGFKI